MQQLTLDYGELVRVTTTPGATVDEQFARFHAANPHVFANLLKLTRREVQKGRRHWSVKGAYEVLRWNISETTGADYKLNNNFTAIYARLLNAEPGVPDDFYRTRERRQEVPNV